MESEKKAPKKTQVMEKEKNQHIQVVVRARPMNTTEKRLGASNLVTVVPERKEIIVKEKPNATTTKTFTFDKVFGPNSKQCDVYKEVVVPILDEVLMGYNCTIFAYGQTGTGKTFTMEGERSSDPDVSWETDPLSGVIPRTLNQLFDILSEQQSDFTVRVSFVELYNEELFDLLTGAEDTQRLRLFDDPLRKGSVVIHGLEEVIVRSKDEVYEIMERGAKKRQTASTLLNAQSSRSHSVFSITVHIRENTLDGEELLKTGKLYLVDLAGSENIGRSGAVDKRAREAGNINQSLLTLGRVITCLVEHAPHVPYRESKLTRLLQDSLGGKTKTSIIATVSPSSTGIEETISTLDYAFRAKNITNRPEVNQKLTKKALMKEYAEEMERLRRDLQAAREKNGIFIAEENYNAMQAKIVSQGDVITELEEKIVFLREDFEKLNELFTDTQKNLEATKQHLEMTKSKYVKAKVKFYETKKTLKQTCRERDEKNFLVDVHSEKENILHSQAEELLNVSKRATSNLAVLHSKIDRKEAIEQKNLSTLHNFQKFVEAKINNMQTSLSEFVGEQKSQTESARIAIEKRLTESRKCADAVTQILNHLQNDVDLKRKSFVEKLQNDCHQKLQLTNSLRDQMTDIVNFAINEINNFHTVAIAKSMQDISTLVQKSNENLNAYKVIQFASQQRTFLALESFSEKHLHSLSSLFGMLNEHKCSQVSVADDILKTVADASKEQIKLKDEIQHAQELLDAIATRQTKLVETQMKKINSLTGALVQNELTISDSCIKFQDTLVSGLNIFDGALKENCCKFETETAAALQRLRDVNAECTHGSDVLIIASKKAAEEMNETLKTNQQKFQDTQKVVNESDSCFVLDNISQIQIICDCIDKERAGVLGTLTKFVAHSEESTKERFSELDHWSSVVDKFDNLQNTYYSVLSTSTDSVVNEKIVRDKKTGDTPARTPFQFPTDLIRTSPHSQLIERYHASHPSPNISMNEESFNVSAMENVLVEMSEN